METRTRTKGRASPGPQERRATKSPNAREDGARPKPALSSFVCSLDETGGPCDGSINPQFFQPLPAPNPAAADRSLRRLHAPDESPPPPKRLSDTCARRPTANLRTRIRNRPGPQTCPQRLLWAPTNRERRLDAPRLKLPRRHEERRANRLRGGARRFRGEPRALGTRPPCGDGLGRRGGRCRQGSLRPRIFLAGILEDLAPRLQRREQHAARGRCPKNVAQRCGRGG